MTLSNQFNIRISHVKDKTQSRFGAKKDKAIVYHNDSKSELTVRVSEPDVLCDASGPITTFFVVAPGANRAFTICQGFKAGRDFKYTAQIEGAAAEDPIIIIE
ncbi:MAG: hypothetical protein ACRETT_07380 [Steroidobacteraceae bacterium]